MSDALARPYDPFEIVPRFVWVECPLPEYAGFSVKVRSNLRNRDRKLLLDLIADVDAERKRLADAATKRLEAIKEDGLGNELVDLIDEMTRLQDANNARIPAAVSAHVVGWNLQERDDDGNYADAPPPSEAGPDAFEAIEQPMVEWIVQSVVTAYRSGKSISSSKTRGESDGQPSASSETSPPASDASAPPSSASSSTPSASTSET